MRVRVNIAVDAPKGVFLCLAHLPPGVHRLGLGGGFTWGQEEVIIIIIRGTKKTTIGLCGSCDG